MVRSQTPTLARIKNEISLNDARALLSIALCEVCDFFNVGKNMNDTQIALTVDLILENYWYFHLEEIKYCLHRAMMRERLFDRLDGNIILGWLRDYDTERTEEAMCISEQEAMQAQNAAVESQGALSYGEYIEMLKERAATEKEAAELLKEIESHADTPLPLTREQRQQKEHEFKMWRTFVYQAMKR